MAIIGSRVHLDQVVITLARDLQAWELRMGNLKRGMGALNPTDLETYGYSSDEAGKIMDAIYAMSRIVEIMNGSPQATGATYVDGIYTLLGID